MDDYSRPTTTHKTPQPKIGFVFIIPIGLFLGFLIFTANFVLKQQGLAISSLLVLPGEEKSTPTPGIEITNTPTKKPTPTEIKAAVDKENLAIKVLNGSGVAGAAGKAAALLKEEGYTSVTTGNADAYDYTDITIRYLPEAKSAVPELRKVLEKDYTVSETEETDLTGSTEVEILIGKTTSDDE